MLDEGTVATEREQQVTWFVQGCFDGEKKITEGRVKSQKSSYNIFW